jgi:hypothetical protein
MDRDIKVVVAAGRPVFRVVTQSSLLMGPGDDALRTDEVCSLFVRETLNLDAGFSEMTAG